MSDVVDHIKTLIGKEEYLFLINDTCNELEVHCNNLNLVKDKALKRYSFDKFLLIVFPNKSLIYKDFLPNEYVVKYRPALDEYRDILKEKVVDTYDLLNSYKNTYYKTDTHINVKGGYLVYKYFIHKLNEMFHLNIQSKEISLNKKVCELSSLHLGIGDLLWQSNLGNQNVNDKLDTFYFSDEIQPFCYKHFITSGDEIRILDKKLHDKTKEFEGSVISWNIVSDFILYKKNNIINGNNSKVLIFYDSFLLSTISLYLHLFGEVYMSKSMYDNEIINNVKPDYVFEFRTERFLF